jgi:selenocysteine-specific translation elongation factor
VAARSGALLSVVVASLVGSDQVSKKSVASRLGQPSDEDGLLFYYGAGHAGGLVLLDEKAYPGKIQDVLEIVSLSDLVVYVLPRDGHLTWMDGELALLVDFMDIRAGRIVTTGNTEDARTLRSKVFKGLSMESYNVYAADDPSIFSVQGAKKPRNPSGDGLQYISVDRAFNVKGVGLVVLGFVVSGNVHVHDQLKVLPQGKPAEVRSIQIMDVDVESAYEGSRVGLCLKGVSVDDFGSGIGLGNDAVTTSHRLYIDFKPSPYFRQGIHRPVDLHIRTSSGLNLGHVAPQPDGRLLVTYQKHVPLWDGQRAVLVDLGIKRGNSRVVGGGTVLRAD